MRRRVVVDGSGRRVGDRRGGAARGSRGLTGRELRLLLADQATASPGRVGYEPAEGLAVSAVL